MICPRLPRKTSDEEMTARTVHEFLVPPGMSVCANLEGLQQMEVKEKDDINESDSIGCRSNDRTPNRSAVSLYAGMVSPEQATPSARPIGARPSR